MRNPILSLMVKDFRAFLSEKMTSVTLFVMLAFCAFFNHSANFAGLYITVIMIYSYIVNIFSFEEKYHTEHFFASLAVRRRDIVIARYANVIVLVAACLALAFIANTAFVLARHPAARPIPFGYFVVLLATVSVFPAVSLPFYFKLGIMKARALTILMLLVPMSGGGMVVGLASSTGSIPSIIKAMGEPLKLFSLGVVPGVLLAAAALALWAASIPLAVRFYERRDL